jgi:exopolysaccharide biosynthesis polyprenyl glycosylphosphotransferase
VEGIAKTDMRAASKAWRGAGQGSAAATLQVVAPSRTGPLVLDAGVRSRRASAPSAERVRAELRRAGDAAVAVVLLLVVGLVGSWSEASTVLNVTLPLRQVVGVGIFALAWPVIFLAFGLYDTAEAPPFSQEFRRVAAACAVGTLLAGMLALLRLALPTTPVGLAIFWTGVTGATLALRTSVRAIGTVQTEQAVRRVLLVGSGPRAQRLYRELRGASGGSCRVIGFVDSDAGAGLRQLGLERVGGLTDLEQLLMRQVVDEVMVALPIKSCYSEIQKVIEVCERTGTQVRYLADLFHCTLARSRFDHTGGLPVVAMRVPYDDARLWVKRVLDVLGAGVGVLLLSPLMLLIAAGVKATSPGPALFAQERIGLNKRRFRMFKFRTMVADAVSLQDELEALNEMSGAAFKIEHDPRITPFGRLLRRTSLDELPQLFNVLAGKMSLVGPRPLPMRDVDRFDEPWLVRRFSVLPGLTCLWQIGGRNTLGFDDWMALDLRYIDEWSLWLDLNILLKTLPAVVRGTGAR